MKDIRIISVHIPKTAGTSFVNALEQGLGIGRVKRDYGNRVGRLGKESLISDAEAFSRNFHDVDEVGIQCIHGHFPPQKYRHLIELGWMPITWLREPAAQLLSSYRHIQRTANTFVYGQDTIAYVTLLDKLDFKDYALHPMTKNFMQRFFCDDLPYAFVGITERYRDDLNYFSRKILGSPLPYTLENSFSDPVFQLSIDVGLKNEIERVHDRDYELYRYYLELSRQRPIH
jgi:Sulfotransferase family